MADHRAAKWDWIEPDTVELRLEEPGTGCRQSQSEHIKHTSTEPQLAPQSARRRDCRRKARSYDFRKEEESRKRQYSLREARKATREKCHHLCKSELDAKYKQRNLERRIDDHVANEQVQRHLW